VLRDGSRIDVGRIRLRVAHTPGHTPEHLTFFVSDLERGENPVGALTGDFVFVGDVGRPDLLERAAGAKGSMDSSARELFKSVNTFKAEPDHLQLWPGHGAGSACGKSLGSMPQSTLGYEKLFNWAFGKITEGEFVAKVLEDQPAPPRYFAVMKRVNRSATAPQSPREPTYAGLAELEDALKKGGSVVDTRSAAKFAAGHVAGTLNIPLGKSFLNWSGALIPDDTDFWILTEADSDDAVKRIVDDLSKVGLTRVAAVFRSDVFRDWKSRRGELETVAQVDPQWLQKRTSDGVQVIDVRSPEEWRKGHLPGAIHIPLAQLPERIGELDASAPIVMQCQGGGRSSIATSLLQSQGLPDVSNLAGGYDAWVALGYEVESGRTATSGREPKKS
jgi:hydroxyacylglutathione hydrolase